MTLFLLLVREIQAGSFFVDVALSFGHARLEKASLSQSCLSRTAMSDKSDVSIVLDFEDSHEFLLPTR